MKTDDYKLTITAIILFLTIPSAAQNSQINWSAFSAGFGISNSSGSIITAATGGSFAGISSNGNSKIISGFFAYSYSFVTDVAGEQVIVPKEFELYQNFPNPFNPSTNIKYSIPLESHIKLTIYDILGSEVITLVDEIRPIGYYTVTWNGINREGDHIGSGVYFYRLEAGDFIQTRKFIMVK